MFMYVFIYLCIYVFSSYNQEGFRTQLAHKIMLRSHIVPTFYESMSKSQSTIGKSVGSGLTHFISLFLPTFGSGNPDTVANPKEKEKAYQQNCMDMLNVKSKFYHY